MSLAALPPVRPTLPLAKGFPRGFGGVVSIRLTMSSRRRAVSSSFSESSLAAGGLFSAMSKPSSEAFASDDSLWNEAHLALGKFLSAWGDVENVVAVLFRDFGVPDRGIASVIFRHMTTRSQIETVRDLLLDQAPPGQSKVMVKLLERTVAASGRRNSIIHAHWSLLTPPPILYRVSQSVTEGGIGVIMAGIKGRHEAQGYRAKNAFSVAEITKETAALRRLRAELLAERKRLLGDPSPDTPL